MTLAQQASEIFDWRVGALATHEQWALATHSIRHDRERAIRGNCGCSVRTLVCQRATSCEELLRCCAPLSDEYRAEPNQDGTCQNTQYSPGRGDVSRKRRNCNHHGQNKLDGCGDVILPPRGWRFGIPTVHCRRVGHPFLHATAAMLPGIDMIERTTSGRSGRANTVSRSLFSGGDGIGSWLGGP